MPFAVVAFLFICTAGWLHGATVGELSGHAPLMVLSGSDRFADAISDSVILDDADPIEAFLTALDGAPPDWTVVYGMAGTGHDERLFALNRHRDELRRANERLDRRVTFFWPGQISGIDGDGDGFRIAVGPKIIPTRWGLVRFKPENLPGNLTAVPTREETERIRAGVAGGKTVDVQVAMTGKLVPEESIIYDFAHEEPGKGMVMPVVWIEEIRYAVRR
jgi:hypothetical protein